MEESRELTREGKVEVPKVGQVVLLHVPDRRDPIEATVTMVTQHASRPPTLNVSIEDPRLAR